MSSIRPTVLIVDPFSSGAQFSERIKQKYGYNCLALITNTKLPQLLLSGLRKTDFTEIFTLNDSIDEMIIEIERVLGGPPEYIVCGSEPGVLVFDVLSNCWNLSPNDVKKSRARRDKYLMMEQLRNDGICHIPSFKSSSIDQILEWIKTQKLTDIVVKPIMSFGTEGVHFCHNENEIRTACENLLGKVDYSGNINQEVLVQKLIYGDEYVVDVVSSNGLHHVVNMFKYTKQEIEGVPLYQSMISVNVDDHPELENYIISVLDSLGIQHGPSHNEIILTDSGPVLVESGSRMHGGLGPKLVEETNSQSLIDLSLLSRIDQQKFLDIVKIRPHLHKYAVEYFMASKIEGTVIKNNVKLLCSSVKSYFDDTCTLQPGDYVAKTCDLVSSYARIVMINKCLNTLVSDLGHIIQLDKADKLMSIVPLLGAR